MLFYLLVVSVTIGKIFTVPYSGNSLWTTIKLEKPPDFGFIINLAWKISIPTMQIVPDVIQFDSGEDEK